MSKIKVNDEVIIRATGAHGVVKGREEIKTEGNRVKIQYVVRTDSGREGFGRWWHYSKEELVKVVQKNDEEKLPSIVVETNEGYKITLVALVSPKFVWVDVFDNEGQLYCPYKRKGRELKIGYSICNPKDEFVESVGIKIAKHRAKVAPFCHLASGFNGEFNKETIAAILYAKSKYIADNIKQFVKQ